MEYEPPTLNVTADAGALCLEVGTEDLHQILEDHFSLLLQMSRTSSEQAVETFRALGSNRGVEEGFAAADDGQVDRRHAEVYRQLGARPASARRSLWPSS